MKKGSFLLLCSALLLISSVCFSADYRPPDKQSSTKTEATVVNATQLFDSYVYTATESKSESFNYLINNAKPFTFSDVWTATTTFGTTNVVRGSFLSWQPVPLLSNIETLKSSFINYTRIREPLFHYMKGTATYYWYGAAYAC